MAEKQADTEADVQHVQAESGQATSVELEIEQYRKDKAKAKSAFTRCRHRLLLLIEEEDLPSRTAVRDACQKLDRAQENALDVMSKGSKLFTKVNDTEGRAKVVTEMEKLESEFSEAYESARSYLDSRKDEQSSVGSVASEPVNIEQFQLPGESENFGTIEPDKPFTMQSDTIDSVTPKTVSYQDPGKLSWPPGFSQLPASTASLQTKAFVTQHTPLPEQYTGLYKERDYSMQYDKVEQSKLNAEARPFKSKMPTSQASIGQDLWKQLKRLQIPVFSGDKRQYQGWKASFMACIDNAPATGEYKLLQLRQYLSGEALRAIENLGHSATAYEVAKERLDRKFGGMRRQVAVYLEDLENFKPIREGNSKDIEKFADLLDIAVINLQEAGQYQEMGNGSLYTKLQKKMPESLLARYHRWVYEKRKQESVVTLREWILQESEFQTIASETVHGLTSKASSTNTGKFSGRNQHTRTFFSDGKENENSQRSYACRLCEKQHGIWYCPDFTEMDVPKRWDCAKNLKLCYRCLGHGHRGNACLRSRKCGIHGCQESHNRLLHRDKVPQQKQHSSTEGASSATERNKNETHSKPQTTMVTQGLKQVQSVALRTVPVILKNGNCQVTVNALLDDASTKTYINSDIAAELGLQGKPERVIVNVLNGQVETFATTPVQVSLASLDGSINRDVVAYTADRVTGSMTVVNWNKCASQWRHLEDVNFPQTASRDIVDILIGLDCADLHYCFKEVRGRPWPQVMTATLHLPLRIPE